MDEKTFDKRSEDCKKDIAYFEDLSKKLDGAKKVRVEYILKMLKMSFEVFKKAHIKHHER